jgi:hypothetical protein
MKAVLLWILDSICRIEFWLVLGIVACLVLMVWSGMRASEECEKRGGKYKCSTGTGIGFGANGTAYPVTTTTCFCFEQGE